MSLSDQQLEWIVREVVRRLRAEPAVQPAAADPPNSQTGGRTLVIQEKLLTTHTVRDRLDGVGRIQIARGTVVTPAVRDLLNDHRIVLDSVTR